MSAKHTPGPWLIADSDLVYALHEHKGRQVNRFSAAIDHYPSQGGTADEGKANARLIAAAPDLLEALAGIIKDYWLDIPLWRVKAARVAIAKATGEDAL